jgi:hypothetical protein
MHHVSKLLYEISILSNLIIRTGSKEGLPVDDLKFTEGSMVPRSGELDSVRSIMAELSR